MLLYLLVCTTRTCPAPSVASVVCWLNAQCHGQVLNIPAALHITVSVLVVAPVLEFRGQMYQP